MLFDLARIDKLASREVEVDVFARATITIFHGIFDGRTAVIADIAVVSFKQRIAFIAKRLAVEIFPAA